MRGSWSVGSPNAAWADDVNWHSIAPDPLLSTKWEEPLYTPSTRIVYYKSMIIYIHVPWTFRYNVISCFGFYFNSINTYQMSSLRVILCILLLESR